MTRAGTAVQKPARKTTHATLGPETWGPIAKWIKQHLPADAPPGMLIDAEALPGIRAVRFQAGKLAHNQDMKLRLHHHTMDALYQQFRFWECCTDELSPKFRDSAPAWEIFQEAALEIEGAQMDAEAEAKTRQRGRSPVRPPICSKCNQPVREGGRATVDLDRQGRVATIYSHLTC